MLDTDTKRRIDTARDILVGKVPDPKSQVEQITIALIYKFMDDMDAEAEEMGGHRKFFAGDFARYGWAKLMRSGLGGHETLNLYAEAIAKMPENPGIPLLFRDIFKNAYLPYRDPETLKAFLKIIDEFSYDHSERLGDAFEYLLSVLGSQGDAGQFRTPRHIIDFMVEVLDPKKNETVLDPACGTAGFLISAWKHVQAHNTSKPKPSPPTPLPKGEGGHSKKLPSPSGRGAGGEGEVAVHPGDLLTPDERGRLAENIKGYDISPDMVRLSLVNLYLHGFAAPHIYEYDTLTSEERWNDFADVILANPPFMSPKGGIKPHKRFSIQAKRSEVLFVDYMAEHLTPTGRAGIIVPEGIIFQSQDAYKSLRKMLVENSLVAVVSLPAGCFNPYSGVKTSILILDKTLAKRAQTIAFFKVENDGFGLGAQRREITKNDLPQVKAELHTYLQTLRRGQSADELNLTTGLVISKEKLSANGDYNLSCERYRESDIVNQKWPMVELGTVARLINGRAYKQEELLAEGPMPVLRVGNFFSNRGWYYSDLELEPDKYCNPGDLLFAWSASFGPRIWDGPRAIYHYHIWKIEPTDAINKMFLFHLLAADAEKIKAEGNGIAMVHATKGGMEVRKFPLPPLEIQKEIVAEIEGYQKIIDGARAVLDNYRPHIPIDPAWPMVELGELFKTKSGTTPPRSCAAYFEGGTIPWVKTLDLRDGAIRFTDEKITQQALADTHLSILPAGTVLVAMYGGFNQIGRTGVLEIEATHNQAMTALLPTSRVCPYFLNSILVSSKDYWKTVANSTRKDPNITKTDVLKFKLPLPPIETQRAIVAEIEAEQGLVNANRELITRFETKIQTTLARVWGE